MKKAFTIVLLLLAVFGSIWLWSVLFPSDEIQIQRQLDDLEETVSFDSSGSNIAKLANASKVAGFFATNAVIEINTWDNRSVTLNGRQDLRRTAMAAQNAVSRLTVRFVDLTVTVRAEHRSATAHFAVIASSSQQDEFVQEVETSWVKSDGDWLIQHVKTVDAIRR